MRNIVFIKLNDFCRTLLAQRLTRRGIVVSVIVHACAGVLLASFLPLDSRNAAEFIGSPQAISLEAAFAEPNESPQVVEMAPIQIQPGVAWIAERRFVDSVVMARESPASIEVATTSVLQPEPPAQAKPLSEPVDRQPDYQPMPRTNPTVKPQLPTALPQPSGVEAKTPPRFLNNRPPRYPQLAKQRGWEGDVLLRLSIDETGKITKVIVERTSGYPILDGAAVGAVRTWRAEPARRYGKAVATVELLPVQFRR